MGDGGEHRRDQFGVGRQREIFLCAGMDRGDGGAGVVVDAAGGDRHMHVFGGKPVDEIADVEPDIDHDEVGAAGAKHLQRLLGVHRVGDVRTPLDGDLGRRRELAFERSDDEKPHGPSSCTSR